MIAADFRDDRGDAVSAALERLLEAGEMGRLDVHDHLDRMLAVVERDDLVREHEGAHRTGVFALRLRELFEEPGGLVVQTADRAARERGQFGVDGHAFTADDAAERVQGVPLILQHAAFAVHLQVRHAVLDREDAVRIHAQERIPSQRFAALHALQQGDVVVLHEPFQHGHRRVHVARDLPADRHDLAGRGQRPELLQRCFFHGFSSRGICFVVVFMSDDLIQKRKNRIRFPGPDTVSKEKGGSIV